MKKELLIVNPGAGAEKAGEYEALAAEKLKSYFDDLDIRYTQKALDATNFAKEAAKADYDSVFCMGGDGTVNETVNGLLAAGKDTKFGFFPLGTVNDLARALNLSLEPKTAIEELRFDSFKSIDVGKVNDKYFTNVVAIGTIPEAINNVEAEEKTRWGKLAYFISGFKSIMDTQAYKFSLEIDGEVKEITSSTIIVAMSNTIGGFEQLLPDAEVDDAKLHLVYLKDPDLLDSIRAVPELISGVRGSGEMVEYTTFERLKVSLLDKEASIRANVDGDEGDALPLDIGLIAGGLKVYCP